MNTNFYEGMDITDIVVWAVVLLVSAIPLNIAVKLLGGRSSLLKVVLVNILVAVLVTFVEGLFGIFAGIVSFVVMLFVYKTLFQLGWVKAFLAWVLQFVLIVLFVFLLTLIGITLVAL